MTSILFLTVISLIFTGGLQSQADAISLKITSAIAKWTAVSGGTGITGLNTDEVRWGTPATGSGKSGLKFVPITTTATVATNTPFALGTLTHFNFPVFLGGTPSTATLGIDMIVSNGNTDTAMFTFSFAINETPNAAPCGADQVSTTPCDDIITFPGAISPQTVTIDGVDFTLTLLGFGPTANNLINKFVTEESKSSTTTLFAQLESDEPPTITAPADVTAECSETGGASNVALGDPDIDDFEDADAALTVGNNAPSFYPLGSTTVIWTVTDTDGNSASATQTVTVVDTTPPSVAWSCYPQSCCQME